MRGRGVIRWRVYYDDGIESDSRTPVQYLRGDGVVAIAQADDRPEDPYRVGRILLFDRDFYVWDDCQECWLMVDTYGMYDYLRQSGWKKVLAGRTINRSLYKRILERAASDPDFPAKSARQAGEERLNCG